MFCTNCGRKLAKTAKFCPNCGTPADGDDMASQEQGAVSIQETKIQNVGVQDNANVGKVLRQLAIIQVSGISSLGVKQGYSGEIIVSDSEIWFSAWKYGAVLNVMSLGLSPWNKAKNWRYQLKDILDVRVFPNIVNCSVRILTSDHRETEFVFGRKSKFIEKAEAFREALLAKIAAAK